MARELGRADLVRINEPMIRRYRRREQLRSIGREYFGDAGVKTLRTLWRRK